MKGDAKGILIALGSAGILTGIIVLLKKNAKSKEDTTTVDSSITDIQESIMSAENLMQLNGYYDQIGGMLNAGIIAIEEYDELYMAYLRSYYRLTGVTV